MDQNTVNYLVECAKNGNDNAFSVLYEAGYGMVYHVCLGYLKNPEDAEDTTQEVFIKIYNSLDQLADNSTFFGWAQSIAIHKCLDKLRKRKNHISFEESIGIEETLFGNDHIDFLPDTYVINEEQRRILENIMVQELTDVQYQTVYMFYYNSLPVEQIAKVMDVPVGTVKTRLMNSRIKIKNGIREYENNNDDKITVAGAIPSIGMVISESIKNTPMNFVPFTECTKVAATGTTFGLGISSAFIAKTLLVTSIAAVIGTGSILVYKINQNSGNSEGIEVTSEYSVNIEVSEGNDVSIISNVGANTSVSGVNSNVDDAVTPSTEAVIVRDFPFDRITFRSTFYGDVPSYYSEDGNWYSDRAGETLPFMDFVAQYIDASQIEVDFELQSGANADNVYIEFCDVFGNALYSCDNECTTFVVNESNTPSIYHNGVISDGVYELNVYINGVQYMNSSIYIYDSSTDHVMEDDSGIS